MPTSTARSTQFLLERFSPKQILSINAANRRSNLWEDAVSSGKTIASLWTWLTFVESASSSGELVMIGKTRDAVHRHTLPAFESFPGTAFFMSGSETALGKSSPIYTAMGKRLVAEGCLLYKEGPGPKLGRADVDSYQKFQRKLGYTGSAAKWFPGPTSWSKLKVPNV